MSLIDAAIVKYASLVAPWGIDAIRRDAQLILDGTPCNESRGWYGTKPGCKRDKDKSAGKKSGGAKKKPATTKVAKVKKVVAKVDPNWESKLQELTDLEKNPATSPPTYTEGQILRSRISEESKALLIAKIGGKMPIGYENRQGVVFATDQNGASFYTKTEWFEETRPSKRFDRVKDAIAYAKANSSENDRQREDVVIVPIKTGSGKRYIPFRRIMNAGQYSDYDPRPDHAQTVAESKDVSYRDMKKKTKVLQKMNEYDHAAWEIYKKTSETKDRFKAAENGAVEAMWSEGSSNFGALADHLEKNLTKPHGPYASTAAGKGDHVKKALKQVAKTLRVWEKSPELIPNRVKELIKGRIDVDGATDEQFTITKAKQEQEIKAAQEKGKAMSRQLDKMFGDIKKIENEHGESLAKLRFSRFVEQKRANGKMTDEMYQDFVKKGKVFANDDDRVAAEKIEQQINEIKEQPWV